MNCRRVQKLIPLYVEGDLRPEAAERLASHLEWCGRCNWLADEYRESQGWLRSSQPPDFDEASLDHLKQGVLNRIAETAAKRSLFASLVQHLNRRHVLALAACFIVVLGGVALYVYQAKMKGSPKIIYGVVEQLPGKAPETSEQAPPEAATGEAPGAGSVKRHPASNRRRNFRSLSGHSVVAAQPAERQTGSQISRTTKTAKDFADHNAGLTRAANRSPGMLRIEIQTSDPNIRIIWFAPKETDLHQSKPATD